MPFWESLVKLSTFGLVDLDPPKPPQAPAAPTIADAGPARREAALKSSKKKGFRSTILSGRLGEDDETSILG